MWIRIDSALQYILFSYPEVTTPARQPAGHVFQGEACLCFVITRVAKKLWRHVHDNWLSSVRNDQAYNHPMRLAIRATLTPPVHHSNMILKGPLIDPHYNDSHDAIQVFVCLIVGKIPDGYCDMITPWVNNFLVMMNSSADESDGWTISQWRRKKTVICSATPLSSQVVDE